MESAVARFCRLNGFIFQEGEVGFGRPCVGILNPETGSWVSYAVYGPDWIVVAEHTAVPAPDAYPKGQYLAVEKREGRDAEAQLESWVRRIEDKGYRLQIYTEPASLTSLMSNKDVMQSAVVDP